MDSVKIGGYTVTVDRNLCIGAATCVAISPSVFEMDGENKAVMKESVTETEANILMAAQSCPVKAVVVTKTETGEKVWPI